MANLFDDIPETEPKAVIAGDTLQWKRTDLGSDYPNDEYSLSYEALLEGNGTTKISISASARGEDYLVSVAAATTATYTAGTYQWRAFITRDSDSARISIGYGTWTVTQDAATGTADPRTHAKTMLDKIESLLEGKADSDVANYSIQGRSLSKLSVDELLTWRNYYKAEVQKEIREERKRNNQGTGALIKVRF
jgi:hypothetical protein